MRLKLLGLILTGLVLIGGTAQAALLSLSGLGGTSSNLPGTFGSVLGVTTGSPIVEYGPADVGSGLSLSGPATLTFEYLGFNAGFSNSFGSGGSTLFTTAASAVGNTAQINAGTGLVPFFFHTSGGGTPATANNGGSITSPLSIAFADLHDGSFLALFNDGGGNPTDDKDFNDMIVRVSVSPVPLPAAAWLLISAVLGLVSFSRIRRRGPQTV